MLAVGVACGLAVGITRGLTAEVAAGLTSGLAVGLVSGPTGGEWPARDLAVVEMMAAMRGRRVRFMTLLHVAAERQVLRQAGAVYQFRHAAPQDLLPTSEPPTAAPASQPRKHGTRGSAENSAAATGEQPELPLGDSAHGRQRPSEVGPQREHRQ
jgi:hypothetical protein